MYETRPATASFPAFPGPGRMPTLGLGGPDPRAGHGARARVRVPDGHAQHPAQPPAGAWRAAHAQLGRPGGEHRARPAPSPRLPWHGGGRVPGRLRGGHAGAGPQQPGRSLRSGRLQRRGGLRHPGDALWRLLLSGHLFPLHQRLPRRRRDHRLRLLPFQGARTAEHHPAAAHGRGHIHGHGGGNQHHQAERAQRPGAAQRGILDVRQPGRRQMGLS